MNNELESIIIDDELIGTYYAYAYELPREDELVEEDEDE